MRFLRLNLAAYGPFRQAALDLSGGESGLHVIYGPNEAGKSSALRGVTDFLFGIPVQTPDAYLHSYKQLRIAADLRFQDGREVSLVRRKANLNSLRLGDDLTPFDERDWQSFWGVVDRDLFQTMFGLNHDRLRRGGKDIAQGEGRLGEALFAGGAGIANLQKVQADLRIESDQLWKSTGRSGAIYHELNGYLENQRRVKEAMASAETWRRLEAAGQASRARQSELEVLLGEEHRRLNRLRRIAAALPLVTRWHTAQRAWAAVRDAPLLPQGFAESSLECMLELKRVELQANDANHELAQLDAEASTIQGGDEWLVESEAVDSLRTALGGYLKAMRDRPGLVTARQLCENEVRDLLGKLGRPADLNLLEQLRVPTDRMVRIQDLGNQLDGLEARGQAARRDCERAARKIATAQEKLASLPPPAPTTELRAIVQELQQAGDLEAAQRSLAEELADAERDVALRLGRLPLWSGDLARLEQTPVPSLQSIDRFADETLSAQRQRDQLEERLRDETAKLAECTEELEQLERSQKVPTIDELSAARGWRDRGWQLVWRAWQRREESSPELAEFLEKFSPANTLADAYRRSVEEADRLADVLRQDADLVAVKTRLAADRQSSQLRLEALVAEVEQARNAIQHVEQRWRAVWQSSEITPLSPSEMREWLRQLEELRQQAAALHKLRGKLEQQTTRIEKLHTKLAATLRSVDSTLPSDRLGLRGLWQVAQEVCERAQEAGRTYQQSAELLELNRNERVEAEARATECTNALAEWRRAWAVEMATLGLGANATPSQANRWLADLQDLFAKYQEFRQYSTRLEGIDRDAREFVVSVQEHVERLAPDLRDSPVEQVVSELAKRCQDARSAAESHRNLQRRRADLREKLRRAQSRLAELQAALGEMCRQAGCHQPDQLGEAAGRSQQRQQLESTIREYTEQIAEHRGGQEFEDFVREVESEMSQIDSLQPRIEQLQQAIAKLEEDRDESIRQVERDDALLKQIDGGSTAAECQAQCESIAARLAVQLEQLAVLRVAQGVLQAGIDQYRERHQGPLLGRASQLFQELTLGRFTRLQADINQQGQPILTGIRSQTGESLGLAGMSDGTCDQVYLAIRLASLEDWLQHHESVPFIADDILLNFDDARAVAGLRILSQLARRTQVIFFTHHQHLVELAQQHLPQGELFVTRLP